MEGEEGGSEARKMALVLVRLLDETDVPRPHSPFIGMTLRGTHTRVYHHREEVHALQYRQPSRPSSVSRRLR